MSVAVHQILVGGQGEETHRATGVELLGGDADLCAKSEVPSVGEAGGGVDVDGGGVDLTLEAAGGGHVLGDNGLAVTRGVAGDVGDGLVDGVHHTDRENEIVVLGVPVLLGCGDGGGQNGTGSLVATEFHFVVRHGLCHHGQEVGGHGSMYQQSLNGVAHRGAGAFGVDGYLHRLCKIGGGVHVQVTVACARFDDDHLPRLKELSSIDYYDSLNVLDYEQIRTEIRELAQFSSDGSHIDPIFVDYEDTVKTIDVPEGAAGPVPADNFEEYKKKVDAYLSEHMNDAAIVKLRTNKRLTKADFNNLNHIFKKQLGNEKMFDEISEGRSLGVFIRHVTKMDRKTIDDYFAEFINKEKMNALQIEFVQRLVNFIVEQGEVNEKTLMMGKPPFDKPKLFVVFGGDACNKIFEVVKNINENAKDIA